MVKNKLLQNTYLNNKKSFLKTVTILLRKSNVATHTKCFFLQRLSTKTPFIKETKSLILQMATQQHNVYLLVHHKTIQISFFYFDQL
jgi:hypothetical protein